jgi:hypothetical protein
MKVQTIKNDPINSGDEDHSELKLRIMSTWLGWRDSNPRMLVPETSALPLGDTPSACQIVPLMGRQLKRVSSV